MQQTQEWNTLLDDDDEESSKEDESEMRKKKEYAIQQKYHTMNERRSSLETVRAQEFRGRAE